MSSNNKLSKIFALTFGIIGVVFLAVAIGFLLGHLNGSYDPDLLIMALAFSPIGVGFTITGLVCLIVFLSHRGKVKRLKRDGECYEAEIVRIREKPYTNVNYRSPFVVECGYRDRRGTSYLVKSGNVWPSSMLVKREDIKARVWVNPKKPKDYYVEVYLTSEEQKSKLRYDFDYR